MNRLAIIGHFGGTKKFTDGQTVKTINLYKELSLLTNWDIKKVDTYFKLNRPIKFVIQLLTALLSTRNIIVLLSINGMRVFFPLLYICSVVFRKNVYHDVIGGSMAMIIESNPRYKKYLNSFRVNWVETDFLKKELEQQGIQNVAVLPNFRRVEPLNEKDLRSDFSEPFAFCTFSRVIKEKGIEEAICAIQKINQSYGRKFCRLDIYGPIGENYLKRFKSVMAHVDSCVRYCGEVPSDKAVDTLRHFYATLFPTYWEGEGCAGTITESFFAGVPVIATNWRCNPIMESYIQVKKQRR